MTEEKIKELYDFLMIDECNYYFLYGAFNEIHCDSDFYDVAFVIDKKKIKKKVTRDQFYHIECFHRMNEAKKKNEIFDLKKFWKEKQEIKNEVEKFSLGYLNSILLNK